MAWATIAQLEDHLGAASDARMTGALAISETWCHRQRPDLPADGPVPADVQHAVLVFAGLLYRERSTPQGFATYDAIDGAQYADQSAMVNVYRLLGTRKPVAR